VVTVRELTTADVSRVARIFGKASKATQAEIAEAATGGNLSMMTLFLGLLDVEDDMREWMADLIGVTEDEFDAMPATTILDIIEQLTAMPEAQDFFSRASRMAGAAWKRMSTVFNIDTAGMMKPSSSSGSVDSEESSD